MDDPRLKKIRFRCWHRGFREADLILGPFADANLERLSSDELDEFERLIDQPDHDLYGWITGAIATPEAFEGDMLDLIRSFRFFARAAFGADHGG